MKVRIAMPACREKRYRINAGAVPGGKASSWLFMLGGFFLLAPLAVSRTTAEKLDQARSYFDQAKAAHAALEATPADQRAQKDYARVIEAFRRVYLTAPTYGNNTICLMEIGGLSEEAARRFAKPDYFQSAIESYEFLLQEYPASQFRFEALLSIARIYRQDLLKPEEALKQYERYLKAYPRSNLEGGIRYLKYLMGMFEGDLQLSLAAYNAGEDAVARSRGVPPFRETQDYIRKITQLYPLRSVTNAIPPVPRIEKYVDSRGVVHFSNIDVP